MMMIIVARMRRGANSPFNAVMFGSSPPSSRHPLPSDGKRTFQDFNASCQWCEGRHHARDITLPLLFNFISVRAGQARDIWREASTSFASSFNAIAIGRWDAKSILAFLPGCE
jgi:hypothetical protein